MNPVEPTTSLARVCHILFRHRLKMLASFLGITLVAVLVVFLTPPSYRSQAELFARLGRENVTVDPTATVGQGPVVFVPSSRDNELHTFIEILKSQAVLEKVVDALGPQVILGTAPLPAGGGQPAAGPVATDASPQLRYRAVLKAMKALDVEAVKKSNMILVRYTASSPELAQAILTRVIDFYLERHLALHRAPGANKFFKEQANRLRAELTQTEVELRDLKNTTGLSVPEGQRLIAVTRIGRIQDELLQTAAAVAAAEAEVHLLREKLAALPKTHVTALMGVPNTATDGMRGQLYAMHLRERELLLKYHEQHPDMKLLRQQIESAKAALAKEEASREQVTNGPNRVYEEIQMTLLKQEPVLASLKARADMLKVQLRAEEAKGKALNDNSLRMQKLQREFELQEAAYKKIAENLEHAQIDAALELDRISNISIAQPATFDPQPAGLGRTFTLGLGLVLALFASIGLAFFLDRRDPSVKSAADLEKTLGLPALVSIPYRRSAPDPLTLSPTNGLAHGGGLAARLDPAKGNTVRV